MFEIRTPTLAYNNALFLQTELSSKRHDGYLLHFKNVKQIKNYIFTNTIIKKIRRHNHIMSTAI